MNVTCPHCGAPRKGSSCPYCGVVFDGAGGGTSPATGLPPGVAEALQRGNKIEAIKHYREGTKCSLLEAKNAVDALEARFAQR